MSDQEGEHSDSEIEERGGIILREPPSEMAFMIAEKEARLSEVGRKYDQVIEGLDGVFKLVDDLLNGGRDYVQLAERVEALLKRCREAGMTLESNKV